jgi:cytochrome c oxidase assembly factor CtaG
MPAHFSAFYGSGAYHGPPELTVSRAFSEWVLDPWALAAIVVAAVAYAVAVRRVRGAGQRWPAGRIIAFSGLGLGFAVIATMSSVAAYRPVLFYARAAQTVVMLLVVPLFLALGRPISLVIAAYPTAGARIERALRTRTAKIATFPAITTMILVVTPFMVYFTSWYAAGFGSALVRELTFAAFVVPGFVFFWTLLRVDPVPAAYPYVVLLWIAAAEIIGDAILGLAIVADPSLIAAAYYHAVARPWGPSLATDQVLGGGTIWVLGDMVGLPFLVAQLIQMIREDEDEAKVIDAELDAADAEAAAEAAVAAAGSGVTADAAAGAARPARPWWEADPRFGSRFESVTPPDQEGPA